MLSRRNFLRSSVAAAGALSFNPSFLRGAFAREAKPGPSPYGPLGAPDANGIRLPEGFSSRLIARHNFPVGSTPYLLPPFPDGTATYKLDDGGWILAVNSEHPVPGEGGASSIRFDKDGEVTDAYRILGGTQANCSGGKTPWNTWLSCEEHEDGHVWECDIFGEKDPVELPAMGTRSHEAACVDPVGKRLYLVEDEGDSGFYRFTPAKYPDLTKGLLEVARVDEHGLVEWTEVPDPAATTTPNRKQVDGMTKFRRGEGLFFDHPFAFVTTSSDATIHAYNVITETMESLWQGDTHPDSPAVDIDQMTYSAGGEIFVCEDEGDLRISLLSADGKFVAPFLQLDGLDHVRYPEFGNETTGVVLDPSGTRMYFSGQRSLGGGGGIFEITGPFRSDTTDLREPTLRVEVAKTTTLSRLKGRGLDVTLLSDEPCTVSARIRVPGDRTFTLAGKTLDLKSGKRQRIQLKARKKMLPRLGRRRELLPRLEVTAADARGNERRIVRPFGLSR